MAARRTRETLCYKELVPFGALVSMECINVGLNTLFKAATNRGMSYHVSVAYAYGVAALVLLPSPFFSLRSRTLPPLTFPILCKIGFLGVIGCTSQTMGYKGITYSSPTLASAISNLVPAFTFILAIIFRMERLAIKTSSSKAKIIGTVVSISGALVVTLYRGPKIILNPSASPYLSGQQFDRQFIQAQSPSDLNWIYGSIFLSTEYILVPVWYIIQAHIMKEYPAELTVVFFYTLTVSVLATIVGLFMERDLSKWSLGFDIALVSILCQGVFGSGLNNAVHTWALHLKGPVYVAMFKPLSIAIAVVMGVILLGDNLYLGSVIGATIISVGFYTVMWGKANEVSKEDNEVGDLESSTERFPLLNGYKMEAAGIRGMENQ